jgi:hypothetical protein
MRAARVVVFAAAFGLPPFPVPAAVPVLAARACAPSWTHVQSPPTKNLNGLEALNSTNVWSAGITWGQPEKTFASHTTDGMTWKRVPTPNTSGDTAFNKASFLNPGNGWAVGYSGDFLSETPPWQSYAQHWNGTRWHRSKTQHPGGSDSLTGVEALGPNNVWAAGYSKTGNERTTLIEHWNGTRWAVVPSPSPSRTSSGFTAMTSVGPNDMWAVGFFREGHRYRPLTARWNGTRWNRVASPPAGMGESVLTGVAATSHTNAWAVGYQGGSDARRALFLHWDGSRWQTVPSPLSSYGYDGLLGVAARSRRDAWAVGFSYDPATAHFKSLTERWDGSRWRIVPSPDGQGQNSQLMAVTIAPDTGQVWTGGRSGIFGLFLTICPTRQTPLEPAARPPRLPEPAGHPVAAPTKAQAIPVPRAPAVKVVARSRAQEAGIAEVTRSRGAVVFDYDKDGRPDIFLNRHQFTARLYHNDGNGHFTEVNPGLFKEVDRHYCDSADVNADGRPDLFCAVGANKGSELKQNELWIQQPDHTFVDEARAYGVADVFGRGRDATFIDVDRDGFPDLFLGNSGDRPDGIPSPNRFYLNRGGSSFQESIRYDLNKEFGDSCGQAGDYNADARPDLLLCTTTGVRLYRNDERGAVLRDVSSNADVAQKAKDAVLTDLNGDGRLDIAMITLDDHLRVALQDQGKFELSFRMALKGDGQAIAAGDVNADHRPDLYIARGRSGSDQNESDFMLLNRMNGRDFERTRIPGVRSGTSESVTAFDYDRNGLSDFIVTNGLNGSLQGPVQLIAFYRANG